MEEKFITLEDANGEQTLAEILFTLPHNGDNFVFLTIAQEFDGEEEDESVLVYKYAESEDGGVGELFEIDEEDDETWEMLDEVLETFLDTNFEM